ncbi:hypothetical protein GUJ93_ZPchr0007g4166 [Zizania palustris]|uniref:Homeobox domain-containing protein n=1 Tax=Zizania palustris TaxID=103762 RepID=A0A8J5T0L9_ZIZPA|nr:hypothetical protein GUJ93_ZPchr0007g4166 [Zizania palustris]KAG8077907.1 hypothetical protein GUJ93_ZPchr0007g4166 [Zizania palustris]
MDKTTNSDLVLDNNSGSNDDSAQEPLASKGKTSGVRNRYKQNEKRGRKGSQISPSKIYPLRSAHSSVRVLQSSSKKKNEAPNVPVNDNIAVQGAAKKRKRSKPLRSAHNSPRVLCSASKKKDKANNELVNGNAGVPPAVKRKVGKPSKGGTPKNDEGWKGQSLEKIRPEKELERAKAEILRCKLRIREAFRNLDSLISEGKLEEFLFDSAGEISSEDIFCATWFHQYCLNPPLLAEDIPLGDEGWLCPACDCKIECIDVLNELHGGKLSIHDSWEKVFPEAASFANGSKQADASNLPSDDSADDDYDPALAEGHMADEEKTSGHDGGGGLDSDDSSSEDSESSENKKSKTSKNGKTVDDLGLPSEDSEDGDFDPEGRDSDKDQNDEANSDQSDDSDFTSDSDDFCAEIAKSYDQDEISGPSLSQIRMVDHIDKSDFERKSNAENSNLAFLETEIEHDMVLPVSSKRQVERLDYKKLYDEAYGKESSDSSDDEAWSGDGGSQNGNLEDSETDSLAESPQCGKRYSKRAPVRHQNNEYTQNVRPCGSVSEQKTEGLCPNRSGSTAKKRHFGPKINQKLKEHFKEDPYPSHATKENLAQELGLTFTQVTKWFSSTRHYSMVAAAKKDGDLENHTAENTNINCLNEGSPLRQDTSCQQRVVETPSVVNQNCPTNSTEVGSPRENHGNGSLSNVSPTKVKSSEKTIPGPEHADEARRKALQRELRRMKTSR